MSVRLTVMFKEFRFTNIQTNLHIIGFTCTQNKSCSVFFIYFFLNVCPEWWLLPAWYRKASAFRTGRMSFQSSASTDEWQLSSSVRRHRDAFSDLSGCWTRHSSHWTRHSSHWTRHSPAGICVRFRVQTTTARQLLWTRHVFIYSIESKNKKAR